MKKLHDINIVKKEIVDWTAQVVADAGMKNLVLGISGGADSTVLAKVATLAVGPEHVYGIFMPNGVQVDLDDAKRAAKAAGVVNTIEANLAMAVLAAKATVKLALPNRQDLSVQANTNITPHVRTAVETAIAQTIGDSLIICTANLSELMMGYFTMWADMGSIAPMANLTKSEVRELGLALGLPEDLVLKTPADGLSGQSDEEKMGFTYKQIDTFIRGGIDELSEGVRTALADRMKRMEYKRKMLNIPAYLPAFSG